ncbi:methyltransferase domain-containing protein [Formosa sp. L2A11]|uniref:methyltransferase domain-containing protein n=1 Tax=Formosa sp. L2A11 TaxID=2686363 RepID=UPI00131D61E4|nr:methyltransferase domain-containing protein [Formosa sp. L2A11]
MNLTEAFWNNKYKNHDTRWDLGAVSPPLKSYIDQLTNTDLRILIPGGGNSHEAEYLHRNGFKNVYVVDVSEIALKNIKHRVPSFPEAHLIHKNFFELDSVFDLIIEQTFFCAITPNLRPEYARKTKDLLAQKGKVVGLLFNVPLYEDHPPFGGNEAEYHSYFKDHFNIQSMEAAYNSHESRIGRELFFKIQKQ